MYIYFLLKKIHPTHNEIRVIYFYLLRKKEEREGVLRVL
jgi:hypothetical protein